MSNTATNVVSNPASPPDRPILMSIPPEVRLMILREVHHVFRTRTRINLRRPSMHPIVKIARPLRLPILFVCKDLRGEAIGELFNNSVLDIADPRDLDWARDHMQNRFSVDLNNHVRRIKLRARWGADMWRYLNFLEACAGVKEVEIELDVQIWTMNIPSPSVLRQTFHLDHVGKVLSGLEDFDLYCTSDPHDQQVDGITDALCNLVLA